MLFLSLRDYIYFTEKSNIIPDAIQIKNKYIVNSNQIWTLIKR